jgi:hypothetical protein
MGRLSNALIQRKLRGVTAEIDRLRAEERVIAEQSDAFDDDESDSWTRAVASGEHIDASTHFEASKDAATFRSSLAKVRARIVELEGRRDELLDDLSAELR